ncbi:MAG: peptidylprolyl isomerase [Eubacteriales bacterium]
MKLGKTYKSIILILIMMILIIPGCKNKGDDDNLNSTNDEDEVISGSKNEGDDDNLIFTIDGDEVYLPEIQLYLDSVKQTYEQNGTDIWDTEIEGMPAEEYAKEKALESIITFKVIFKKAEELDIVLTDDEKTDIKKQAKENLKSLTYDDLTEEMLIGILTEGLLYKKVYDQLYEDYEVDEELLEENLQNDPNYIYFIDNAEDILLEARAKHILLKTHDRNDQGMLEPLSEETQEQAKETAEEVLEKLNNGENFVELVHEYSEDVASVETDGEMTFGRNQMAAEFEEATYALEEGEISEIVQTDFGYHIIKLEEFIYPTEDEINEAIASVEKDLTDNFTDMQKMEAYDKQSKEWEDDFDIEINEDVWDEIKLLSE